MTEISLNPDFGSVDECFDVEQREFDNWDLEIAWDLEFGYWSFLTCACRMQTGRNFFFNWLNGYGGLYPFTVHGFSVNTGQNRVAVVNA